MDSLSREASARVASPAQEVGRISDYYESYSENNISFDLGSLLVETGPSNNSSGSPSPPTPSPPVVPRSVDYSEDETNTSFRVASLEARPSYSNGGSPSPPPPPVAPRTADYSEDENNTFFEVASLETGPSYSNDGSPSPAPPPVVPRSADYSEDENNTSFEAALLEAGPSYPNGALLSPPPPVVPRSAGPLVAPSEFIYPGDWGCEFHEALSLKEIRSRKKAAQIKRDHMG